MLAHLNTHVPKPQESTDLPPVLLITSNASLYTGGEGIFTRQLALQLDRDGYDASILRRDWRKLAVLTRGTEPDVELPVPVGYLTIVRDLTFFILFGFLLGFARVQKRKVAVIHAQDAISAGVVGSFISILTRTPLIITLHGLHLRSVRGIFRGHLANLAYAVALVSLRFCAKAAKSIIIVDESLRSELVRNGVRPEKIVRIPTFCRLKTASSHRSRAEKVKLLAFIGRLSAEKNPRLIVEAFSDIIKRFPEMRLLIIGDGPERENLSHLVRERGVEKHVKILGFRRDMEHIYSIIDALVLPSVAEGLPQVALEAWSNEVPIIASSAVPILTSGRDALVFETGNRLDLERKIELLATDDELRRRLRREGQRRLAEEFDPEKVVKLITRVYEIAQET